MFGPGNPEEGGQSLTMKHLESQLSEADNWTYRRRKREEQATPLSIKVNVKNSQSATRCLELSGACATGGDSALTN